MSRIVLLLGLLLEGGYGSPLSSLAAGEPEIVGGNYTCGQASLYAVARHLESFVLDSSVREWSRHIGAVAGMLQALDGPERAATVAKLIERRWRYGHHSSGLFMWSDEYLPPPVPEDAPAGAPGGPVGGHHGMPQHGGHMMPPPGTGDIFLERGLAGRIFLPSPFAPDFVHTFEQQLLATLGPGYHVKVAETSDLSKRAILIVGPMFSEGRQGGARLYDVSVTFPDGYVATFRVTRPARGAPIPRNLFLNLALLVVVMVVALFVTARTITRPLSELARAADSVGRDLRQPKLAETGARELRNAARAFNTMQDRLQRYLDSRSRVLAAMSHDLKTPLTRLRLQVEMLDDRSAQPKISKQLDEMEGMVHGALALFRGLDDDEAFGQVDVDELLATLRSEFAEMNAAVTVEGHAQRPIFGKPQALRRCLTNLIANAIKFGDCARITVEDGAALVVHIADEGPGVPEDQLERVFEPFYRLETSRNRDTGGTGLGLSIARDVIQAHGGTLVLRNLPVRGLEAIITLPRA